jgi:hypothetical protein
VLATPPFETHGLDGTSCGLFGLEDDDGESLAVDGLQPMSGNHSRKLSNPRNHHFGQSLTFWIDRPIDRYLDNVCVHSGLPSPI